MLLKAVIWHFRSMLAHFIAQSFLRAAAFDAGAGRAPPAAAEGELMPSGADHVILSVTNGQ